MRAKLVNSITRLEDKTDFKKKMIMVEKARKLRVKKIVQHLNNSSSEKRKQKILKIKL